MIPRKRQVLASRRLANALGTTTLSSLGTFLLSIAVARSTDSRGLGEFALALASVMIVGGLVRAILSEPLSSYLPDYREVLRARCYAALLGTVSVPLLFGLAVFFESSQLLLVALASPALGIFEHLKYSYTALFDRPRPILMEIPRLGAAVVGLTLTSTFSLSPELLLGSWLAAMVCVVAALLTIDRHHPMGSPRLDRPTLRVRSLFAGEYLVGGGTLQLTTFIIGAIAGLAANGAIRGGGTLLGPASLMVSGVNSLLVPYLARSRGDLSEQLRRGGRIALILAGASLLLVGLLLAAPDEWGVVVLGDSWEASRAILPWLGLDLICTSLAVPAAAAHRAVRAAGRAIKVQSALSPLRLVLVVLAATFSDAAGIAVAMAVASAASGIVWWISFRYLPSPVT